MGIETLALLLLIGRLVAIGFIAVVLVRQWGLLKKSVPPSIKPFRQILFALSVILLVGNFVPIVLDFVTLTSVDNLERPAPGQIAVIYAISNCFTAITAALLIWMLYRMAARTSDITDENIEIALHTDPTK